MAETQSAPSLRELSEAATQGRLDLQEFDPDCGGVPLIAVPDDIPVGGTPTNGLVAVTTLSPVEYPSDRNEADPRRAQTNAAFLARLWNDYRAGRLIDPTLTEAVASARAEGVREGLERAAKAAEAAMVIEYDKFWSIDERFAAAEADDRCEEIASAIRAMIPG